MVRPHRPRRRLNLETLESRRLLAALQPGNLVIGYAPTSGVPTVYEYSPSGSLVQQAEIPSDGGTEVPRDLTVDDQGLAHIFNGTFHPDLASWDPVANSFKRLTVDQWSTVSNVTYGGIGSWQHYTFMTDMNTANAAAQGVVRVNRQDNSFTRFAESTQPIDLTVGQDGLLYVLDSRQSVESGGKFIDVYSPESLTLLRTVELERHVREIAVGKDGQIFGGHPDVYHFDESGALTTQPLDNRGIGNFITDMDIDAEGRLAVATEGKVLVTDSEFLSWTVISLAGSGNTSVAWTTATRPLPHAASDRFEVPQDSSDNILDVLANDRSEPNTELRIVEVSSPDDGGTVEIAEGRWLVYTPADAFVGQTTLRYTIRSVGDGATDHTDVGFVRITVHGKGSLHAGDDTYKTLENESLVVSATEGLLTNDNHRGGFDSGILNEGNIIVSNSPLNGRTEIYEYEVNGARVRTIIAPDAPELFRENLRDVTLDAAGNLQFYGGTFDPSRLTYNTQSQNFTSQWFAGWDTVNNLTFGGVSSLGHYLFATDDKIAFDTDADRGLVRFNTLNGEAVRFADPLDDTIDVAVGRDRLLYALGGSGSPLGRTLNVYDPVSLKHLRTVALPREHRAIAIDEDGTIFAVWRDGAIYKYDSAGNELGMTETAGVGGLSDLDLSQEGRLLAASHGGQLVLTDRDFSSIRSFNTRTSNGYNFAGWIEAPQWLESEIQIEAYTQPGNGRVTVNADGSFTYVPNPSFSGEDQFTYTVLDAFGARDFAKVVIQVTNLNDAPELTSGQPSGTTDEDTSWTQSLSQFINRGVNTTQITDADPSDPIGGIAVTASLGRGTWEYSLDGGATFLSMGDVAPQSARLLPATASLRYRPEDTNSDVAGLTYQAWDQSSGNSGGLADATQAGGRFAFSLASDELSLPVSAVNDAPFLTPAAPRMGETTEDETWTALLASFVTGITDVDDGATVGGIAILEASGNGQWRFSLDGETFADLAEVSESQALLLPQDATLQYVPDRLNGEAAGLRYRAWDQTAGAGGKFGDSSHNGGVTAFSTSVDQATLTVTNVNDAPTQVETTWEVGSTSEDENLPLPVKSLLIHASDVDQSATLGAAITGFSGRGRWEYSLDGANFADLPADTSATAAWLLGPDDWVRYVPDLENGERAEIQLRAWDQTTGTRGSQADTSSHGGTTAFSTHRAVGDLAVASVNDAPVLDPQAPSLGTTDENSTLTVSLSSFVTGISDVDLNARIGGIAVTSLSGSGEWSYSLDGDQYQAFPPVSQTSGLLLPATASLRYVPNQTNGESATIGYRAWDETSGQAGTTVDTTRNGGTTAYSIVQDEATLAVTDVNDAPVLVAGAPQATTSEDASLTRTIASLINTTHATQLTDVDGPGPLGLAISQLTGRGVWHYSLNQSDFFAFPTMSSEQALLLPPSAVVRYTPDQQNGELASMSYQGWDQSAGQAGTVHDLSQVGGETAISSASDTLTLDVTDRNDAPVLVAATPSATTNEDTNLDVAVSSWLNQGDGSTQIHDVDENAMVGIAILGIHGNGSFMYTLDGSGYTVLSSASIDNALLLPISATLRYLPDRRNGETATLEFVAWDQSAGSVGGRADVTERGGETAFSSQSDELRIIVTPVNDRPTDLNLSPRQVAENAVGAVIGQVSFSDPDNEDSHSLTVSDPRLEIVSGQLRLKADQFLNFETEPTLDAIVTVTDSGNAVLRDTFTINVTDENDAPTIAQPLEDQSTVPFYRYSYTVPSDAFADEDGDSLSYSASLADGTPLPTWLKFDAPTRQFSGQPGPTDLGTLNVRVTAADPENAVGIDDFTLEIVTSEHPWQNPNNPLDVSGEGTVEPRDVLIVINYVNRNPGNSQLPPPPQTPPPFYDVAGNDQVVALDALIVINFLNQNSGGEGELTVGQPHRLSLPGMAKPVVKLGSRDASGVCPSEVSPAESARQAVTERPAVGEATSRSIVSRHASAASACRQRHSLALLDFLKEWEAGSR